MEGKNVEGKDVYYCYDIENPDPNGDHYCVFGLFHEWLPIHLYHQPAILAKDMTLREMMYTIAANYCGYTQIDGQDRQIFFNSLMKVIHAMAFKLMGDNEALRAVHSIYHQMEDQIMDSYQGALDGNVVLAALQDNKPFRMALTKQGGQNLLVPDVPLPGGPLIRQCDYTFCLSITEPSGKGCAGRNVCEKCNGVFCDMHSEPKDHECAWLYPDSGERLFGIENREPLVQQEGAGLDGLTGRDYVPKKAELDPSGN